MSGSSLVLDRLRILRGGKPVYDERFHRGVNIIRGQNGSGKSTIADAIFYILGGEFEDWKEAIALCEEVQAEIATSNGIMTIRRAIAGRKEPAYVYFGSMDDAQNAGLDGWTRCSLQRSEGAESYSQVLFRAMDIPEAPSQASSNITMHQILRILYSDQRTPASRLFRFEQFDTRDIREAVGNLLCGIGNYRSYEIQLELRGLAAEFDTIRHELSAAIKALPAGDELVSTASVHGQMQALVLEQNALIDQLESVEEFISQQELEAFDQEREQAVKGLARLRAGIRNAATAIERIELDLRDLVAFVSYLEESREKLELAAGASELVGQIEFTHCPSCLSELAQHSPDSCVLCGSELDHAVKSKKYLAIKFDVEAQLRETRQLLSQKQGALADAKSELKRLEREHSSQYAEFVVAYEQSASPREAFIATRNLRLGQVSKELEQIERLRVTAERIEELSRRKEDLQSRISRLRDELQGQELLASRRTQEAKTEISDRAVAILKDDLPRQEEFVVANAVSVYFADDAVMVDGKMNFAESSNVILKNAAILAIFLASCADSKFNAPRFLLMDNIEDKGMEEARSHNFQKLIVKEAADLTCTHQVIFTTSMVAPELDIPEFTIGRSYTRANRALELL